MSRLTLRDQYSSVILDEEGQGKGGSTLSKEAYDKIQELLQKDTKIIELKITFKPGTKFAETTNLGDLDARLIERIEGQVDTF